MNFDEVISRVGTGSVKFDFFEERGKPAEAWPMWVADMDFRSPPEVLEALHRVTEHGIFGYAHSLQDYDDALCGWYERNFHWRPDPAWVVQTPNVMFAVSLAIAALTEPSDAIMIQQPVYYPFMEVIHARQRPMVVNELRQDETGRYVIDWDDFERCVVQNRVRLFLLCSPHNPVGRVWTPEELRRMGEICWKHGVWVIADEIHADFVYSGHQHTVFASLGAEFAERTVTCTSPSKTFNLAGIQSANAFISNPTLRQAIFDECMKVCYEGLGIPAIAATQAAYAYGQAWRDALVAYLWENILLAHHWFTENAPSIDMILPEGTYLLWLDCRKMGLSDDQLEAFFTHQAHLWLNRGTQFGPSGSGFMRMNIGCPRATLRMALERLDHALKNSPF